MARPVSVHRKSRLTLELAEPVRARIDRLRLETGAESVTEVIRRALALYALVVESGRNGGEARLVLRTPSGEQTLIIPHAIV